MQSHFEPFRQWLTDKNLTPARGDLQFLYEHTDFVTTPKGTMIMEQNRPVQYFYFLNSGVVRLFLKYNDEDISIAFVQAPQFASTIIFLLNQKISTLALETCSEVEALRWSKNQFVAIKENTRVGNLIELTFAVSLLTWNLEREIDRLILSPEDRYQKLMNNHPSVIQFVSVKHIASYLGIHQDSLSRIRNRMIKRI